MKKFLAAVFCLGGALLFAQQTQTETTEATVQSILDKLLRDDKMLNIRLDTRIDYQNTFGDKNVDEYSAFRGQTVKLWFVGEIAPGVRYRVRQRLNKPQNALARDNYSTATDQAFVELDAGKSWTFRLGKQSVQFGTFEYDYNPADIYLPTLCFDDLDAYKTGVNIAYKTGKQVLNLQVINSDAPQFASDKYKNKAIAGLFLWEGSLFNGGFNTRWGYGAFQHSGSRYYSWITLGNQININKFTTELDWYYGDRTMDYGSTVGIDDLGAKYTRDHSIAVNLKYDLGKVKPSIKGVWNHRKDLENSGSYTNGGVQALVEYYPFSDPALKDLQFHAAYAYNRTNFDGAYNNLDGINQNQILVGMRWMFKIK